MFLTLEPPGKWPITTFILSTLFTVLFFSLISDRVILQRVGSKMQSSDRIKCTFYVVYISCSMPADRRICRNLGLQAVFSNFDSIF